MKKNVIKAIGNKLTRVKGQTFVQMKRVAPDAMVIAGIGGLVGGTILACRATMKLDDILEESKDELDNIRDTAADSAEYATSKQMKKDLTKVYLKAAAKVAKLYLPAAIVESIGVGCIGGSHKILKNRTAALSAAYAGLDKAFENYRSRVIEDAGEEKDMLYSYGVRKETVETIEKNGKGKEKRTKRDILKFDMDLSDTNRVVYFDQSCRAYDDRNNFYNQTFLEGVLSMIQQRVDHQDTCLNEFFDFIGKDHTAAGAVLGWRKGSRVSLGMLEAYDEVTARDFVNGTEPTFILNLNYDGVILDSLRKRELQNEIES